MFCGLGLTTDEVISVLGLMVDFSTFTSGLGNAKTVLFPQAWR